MDYTFQLSAYNQHDIETQLRKALEKRTELGSRQKLPGAWRAIDRLNAVPKVPKPVIKRRATRYKTYGVVLLALGVFLLISGLMVLNELLSPLIAGAFCVLFGLTYLLPRRKNHERKFHAAAVKLLAGLQNVEQLENAPVLVRFIQDGMSLSGGQVVPYDSFDAFVETEDLYLLTWNKRVTVLQKRDLLDGTQESFLAFFMEKTTLKPACVC